MTFDPSPCESSTVVVVESFAIAAMIETGLYRSLASMASWR